MGIGIERRIGDLKGVLRGIEFEDFWGGVFLVVVLEDVELGWEVIRDNEWYSGDRGFWCYGKDFYFVFNREICWECFEWVWFVVLLFSCGKEYLKKFRYEEKSGIEGG